MKVMISGCGRIGTAILESLIKERHQIVVVDTNAKVIQSITDKYDVLGIVGNGASYQTLLTAGADKIDLFISVTASDEFNMLSCFVAKKMGAKNTVARIRNSEYNNDSFEFVKKELGINVIINPELLTAQTIFNILDLPSATNVETFSASSTEMIELTVNDNSKIIGVPLYELRKKHKQNFLVCLVQRENEVYIPNGSFTIQAGDKIGLFAPKSQTRKLLSEFGLEFKPIKSVMIVGASKTAYYLSKLLASAKLSVKVVDINLNKCQNFSEEIEGISVVLGDGTSQDLLNEEGIAKTDAFVALTGKDEQNVLMSIYSKNKNVKKVITKITRDEIFDISNDLGLETVITSKSLVANVLVRYARALENSASGKIETLYSLFSGVAEASEFEVFEDFKYIKIPLKDLKISNSTLIAGIIRGSQIIIPGGEDVILPGDKVIVITAGKSLLELDDIIG